MKLVRFLPVITDKLKIDCYFTYMKSAIIFVGLIALAIARLARVTLVLYFTIQNCANLDTDYKFKTTSTGNPLKDF